jgi:tellurite resistance protein TerC
VDDRLFQWSGFFALIAAMLNIDLGVVHRRPYMVRLREALIISAFWICLLNIGMWLWMGTDVALEFTAAYIMEQSLGVDYLFVFILIFTTFPSRRCATI